MIHNLHDCQYSIIGTIYSTSEVKTNKMRIKGSYTSPYILGISEIFCECEKFFFFQVECSLIEGKMHSLSHKWKISWSSILAKCKNLFLPYNTMLKLLKAKFILWDDFHCDNEQICTFDWTFYPWKTVSYGLSPMKKLHLQKKDQSVSSLRYFV